MKNTILILSLILVGSLSAQDGSYQMKGNSDEVEIDFLTSYYDQDGENSAVEGGTGTEALWDASSMIVVNVPLDSSKSLNFNFGADVYSSASTDMIDRQLNSSASSIDVRAYGTVSYSKKYLSSGQTFGARLGFSAEYDYTSISAGLSYAKEWNQGNSEIALNAQAFIDQWQLIYPTELRDFIKDGGFLDPLDPARSSYNFQATYSQVLNTRMQLSLSGELIYMKGTLSTPFHRIFFANSIDPAFANDIERLPDNRLKIPIGIRLNYFPVDGLVLRAYYRYYYDDFGINAHTMSFEAPVKLSDSWTVYPFARYHTQTASDYFAPKFTHVNPATVSADPQLFYTSDYDLSELSSQKYGLGIKYAPLYGLARAKMFNKILMFKQLHLRGAYYKRDTGLSAYLVSINLGFTID